MAIVTLRLLRRETLKRALAGLTVAVVFAARSGEARGFFCSPSASTPLTRSSSPRQRSARRWGVIHRLLLGWLLTIAALLLTLAYRGRMTAAPTRAQTWVGLAAGQAAGDCWWTAHRSRSTSGP